MKFRLTVVGGARECARDLRQFERRVAAVFDGFDAGPSIYRFDLCLELSDVLSRPPWYAELRRYIAFRPRTHGLVGVCAIDAAALRTDADRGARLVRALEELAACTRINKQLPYDFRGDLFRATVRELARSAGLEPLMTRP